MADRRPLNGNMLPLILHDIHIPSILPETERHAVACIA